MDTALDNVDFTDITDNSKYAPKDIPLSKLIELRNKGLSYPEIGKIMNCHHTNVIRRLQDYAHLIDDNKSFKDNRADILSVVQNKIISNITPDDILKASLLQKTTAISQLYDKERLERGLSTQITENKDLILSLQAKIDEFKAEE